MSKYDATANTNITSRSSSTFVFDEHVATDAFGQGDPELEGAVHEGRVITSSRTKPWWKRPKPIAFAIAIGSAAVVSVCIIVYAISSSVVTTRVESELSLAASGPEFSAIINNIVDNALEGAADVVDNIVSTATATANCSLPSSGSVAGGDNASVGGVGQPGESPSGRINQPTVPTNITTNILSLISNALRNATKPVQIPHRPAVVPPSPPPVVYDFAGARPK